MFQKDDFTAEKRDKYARILAARQSLRLKKWREFRQKCKQKKLRTSYAFLTFATSSNIFTSLMKSWCIVLRWGINVSRTKLT